jgi:HEAT repeat protein
MAACQVVVAMLSRSRSTRTLGLAAALAVAPFAAGPGGEAHAQVLARDVFSREPKTPLEAWEVASYLITIGQHGQAAPYVKKFLDANPDDATLLEVRDTYGAGSVLRLADDPATRPYARPLAERLAQASVRRSTDPARMARFIEGLSKSREEQAYAVERLREAGPYAIPPLVRALSVAGLDPVVRHPLAENLGRLDRGAVPALIATLDSPDAKLVADVARALGRIGDLRAVPALTYLAARKPETAAMPMVDQAIRDLTGKPLKSQPRTPAKVLSDEARKYHLHGYRFPGDPIVLWLWDDVAKVPAPVSTPVRDAEGLLGIRAAREAIELDPTDTEAQVNLISLGLDHAPADWKTAALAAGPDILGRVVRSAISDGRPELAARAIEVLGAEVDRNNLLSEDRPNPLIEALQAPDRRVQFAAAEALVNLDPRQPFAGSSRVVPVLARFVSSQAAPRALVIDGNGERGSQVSGFLRGLGYNAQAASTGAHGFSLAAESADVELILVDPNLVNDPWRLTDLLANLKADARTAGIPVFLVGPLDLYDKIKPSLGSFPEARFLVTPAESTLLKAQLDRGFASLGVRALTPQERTDYARRAASDLARVARQPGSPFEPDLAAIEPALTLALNGPVAGADAAVVLGDVPGQDAQRSLADVALDVSKAPALRLVAAEQLARNVRRFGPKLAGDQEKRLSEELASESDPALRDAIATVVGALKRVPDASGARPQPYRSSSP